MVPNGFYLYLGQRYSVIGEGANLKGVGRKLLAPDMSEYPYSKKKQNGSYE